MYDREAGMLHLADVPTITCLTFLERFVSNRLSGMLEGSHPYYLQLNLFASFLWGGLFMVVPLAVNIVSRQRKRVSKTVL